MNEITYDSISADKGRTLQDHFIEVLRPKLTTFILHLQQNSHYSAIRCDIQFTRTSNDLGINISSNAGMWLSHSNMMFKEISDFLVKEYELMGVNEPISVRIKFYRKNTVEDCKKETAEKENSEIERTMFYPEQPKYKLEDIVLPDETANSIKEAIATIENFDIVYNQWNFKSKEPSAKTIICFFGAPGTGKTMCAHAISNSLGKQILIASYADIQSQYVGVGPKNLKAVFQQAEEKKALLFFDEADSFLRKRTSDNSSSASMHYNSMTNEMMKHLEDFNGIVIFATNLTENTDEAFKTRISFSIEFKVPDDKCRAKIIEKMIPRQVPLVSPFQTEDYIEMAQSCEGFVGRDIRNSIKTILSVGAQKHLYPFTKEQFIDGFKKYKENKASFEKNCNTQQKINPMDIYTANGCIHTLLTYAAWVDGRENEIESDYLKLFSKILSRNKLLITSIADLPEFEELCHEVTDEELKKKVMRYFVSFMALTHQEESLYHNLLSKLSHQLKITDDYLSQLEDYHRQMKLVAVMNEKMI